jgi:Uma2 family endonuclease
MGSYDPRHIWAVVDLTRILVRRDDGIVSVHNPLLVDDYSMPAPDIVLLDPESPQDRYPAPEHTRLIVEVAGHSLTLDRKVKGPLYARAGIPEYWIVDLNGERVEVYSEPSPSGYRASRFYLRGESLSPAFASDMVIAVDHILGPPADATD